MYRILCYNLNILMKQMVRESQNINQKTKTDVDSLREEEKELGDHDPIPVVSHRVNLKALTKKKGWKGKWTGREERKYIRFLEDNVDIMAKKQQRKSKKIFRQMSKLIRSRNPDQCRSHHQKLVQYHSTIQRIVQHYKAFVFPHIEFILQRAEPPEDHSKISQVKSASQEPIYSLQSFGTLIRIQIDLSRVDTYF